MMADDDKKIIQRAYDKWSSIYDTNHNRTRDLDAAVIKRLPLNLDQRRVCEAGCGTGKNTRWLTTRASGVIALDFSEGMLNKARESITATNVTFMQHDLLEPWPLEDGSVDVVLFNLVIEHIEEPAAVFTEAVRVLSGGGRLALCEYHPFRQLVGKGARFEADKSTEVVPAYLHMVSDFVNAGMELGLRVIALDEWGDRELGVDTPSTTLPRLLSIVFEK